ncbi:MAG: hypothetical protein ABR878_07785, partial [Roseiarcus sp.]
MADFAVLDGFEGHNSGLSITSLKFVGAHGESRHDRVQSLRVSPLSRGHGSASPNQRTAPEMT